MCRSLTSSFHCPLIGVRDLPSVLVKYGSLRSPISLSPAIGNSNQLSFNGRRERIARKVEAGFAPVSGFSCGLAVDWPLPVVGVSGIRGWRKPVLLA